MYRSPAVGLLIFSSSSDRLELRERVEAYGFERTPCEGWNPGRHRWDGLVPGK